MLPHLPRHHRTVSVVAVNGLNRPVVRTPSILDVPRRQTEEELQANDIRRELQCSLMRTLCTIIPLPISPPLHPCPSHGLGREGGEGRLTSLAGSAAASASLTYSVGGCTPTSFRERRTWTC